MKKTRVSLFKDYTTKIPSDIITLYDWLTTSAFKNQVEKIRSMEKKAEQRVLKAQLPCITPSGIFSYCRDDSLIRHSGYICIDIDGGESNPRITDFEKLKQKLSQMSCIAYCGLSVSGNGVFCLIPIKYPEKHKEHYFAIEECFKKKLDITIDPACKNISRLRGASYDPNPVINLEARIFAKTMECSVNPHKFHFDKKGGHIFVNGEFQPIPMHMAILINFVNENKIDITGDRTQWFSIGCALASEYGEEGRYIFHEFSKHYKNSRFHYTREETDDIYSTCLRCFSKYKYTIATFYYHCKQNGVV